MNNKPNLFNSRVTYKPFHYPWAYEGWLTQQKMHWLPEEVPMHEDVRDWNSKLTSEEKNLLTHIFRFFTQGDVDVARAYNNVYIPLFGGHPEVAMMLNSFANMETVHIAAYSTLLDTVGMPETEYNAFMEYKAMADKHDYVDQFINVKDKPLEQRFSIYPGKVWRKSSTTSDIAKAIAVYSGFTEGLQLFSSFAILLNFSRFNKMKGMCQIVTWSIRDETLHTEYMIKLFNELIKENPSIFNKEFKKEIQDICAKMVELEDKFIDLAFEQGGIDGLTADEVKKYIRFIANKRLNQMNIKPLFTNIKENPLAWLDVVLNGVEYANFFEQRVTEYTKANTEGTWDEAWKNISKDILTKKKIGG